jgi:hypothetical protein
MPRTEAQRAWNKQRRWSKKQDALDKLERVQRNCLKCVGEFTAIGRFNRLCYECRRNNSDIYDYRNPRNLAPGAPVETEGEELRELVEG